MAGSLVILGTGFFLGGYLTSISISAMIKTEPVH